MKAKAVKFFIMCIALVLTMLLTGSITGKVDANSQDLTGAEAETEQLSNYLGVWYDKESVETGKSSAAMLVITGISEERLLFSFSHNRNYSGLDNAIASKQQDGSYLFSYGTVEKDGFKYNCFGNSYKGRFIFDGMKLMVDIEGDKEQGIGFEGEFIRKKGLDEGPHCNLIDFMTDYKTAYNMMTMHPEWNINLIEDKDTALVAKVWTVVDAGFLTKDNCYEVNGISRGSFQKDCIARFGAPVSIKKAGNYLEVTYLVDNKYHFETLLNKYGAILTMKVSYADEEEVLGYTITDNFKLKGSKIVEYIGGYYSAKKITIPEGVTEIGTNAFSIEDDIFFQDQRDNMKKLSLCIPKNVHIEEYAFNTIGPMKITFEEGRTVIEKRAFSGCGTYMNTRNYKDIEITLPSTVRIIEEGAFESFFCNGITLNLNEGLEIIGDYALRGTKCSLPSTVKKLGDYALYDWWYDYEAKGELSGGYVNLPDGLIEIGNHCIFLECPTRKIKIPASVKKIGECPVSYGANAYKGGVIVDKKNSCYKSDKNGWLYSKDGKTLLYAACFSGDLEVPEGVEYVGEGSLNLDINGEGVPQKIILPKSLKRFNHCAASNASTIVFKGKPPKLVGTQGEKSFKYMTLYVPKSKVKEYKESFKSWGCKIIGY